MAGFIVPAVISGIGSIFGGLFGNRSQTTNQNYSNNTQQSGQQNFYGTGQNNFSNVSMPTYDPAQLQMRNFLLNQFYNRSNPQAITDLTNSAINQGVENYNQGYRSADLALQNNLAQRGLQYSPAGAAASSQLQNERIGNIVGLRNQAPMLRNQLQESALTDFSNFLSRLPVGTASSGTQNTIQTGDTNSSMNSSTSGTGQVTQPGNMLGGLFNGIGGLGGILASLYGSGAFGKSNNSSGGGGWV